MDANRTSRPAAARDPGHPGRRPESRHPATRPAAGAGDAMAQSFAHWLHERAMPNADSQPGCGGRREGGDGGGDGGGGRGGEPTGGTEWAVARERQGGLGALAAEALAERLPLQPSDGCFELLLPRGASIAVQHLRLANRMVVSLRCSPAGLGRQLQQHGTGLKRRLERGRDHAVTVVFA